MAELSAKRKSLGAYLRYSHHATAQIANTATATIIGVSIMRCFAFAAATFEMAFRSCQK